VGGDEKKGADAKPKGVIGCLLTLDIFVWSRPARKPGSLDYKAIATAFEELPVEFLLQQASPDLTLGDDEEDPEDYCENHNKVLDLIHVP